MRILGIDPGSEKTGYGLIESDGIRHFPIVFGAIRTSPRKPFHERLLQIYAQLMEILANRDINAVAIEGVFHAANVQSALKLGHARGVALLVAAQQGLPVFEYSPLEVKSALVGYGRAEKSQIQLMVQLLLELPDVPTPEDAADALAVAICHSHRTVREIPGRPSGRNRPKRR
ncbi:MAG: crossover junction endodeoxyribonuclease RuvC [Acidobacteria bacterium]|nr:crossover junction endodeoxyribonuclease RuvC [Acidobacteriota bacterium]